MNSLRALLVLFVFIGSKTIAKQPKQVIKSIGKRFNVDKIFGGPLQKIRWNFMTPEEFNRTKIKECEKIGLLIQSQSSFENWAWRQSEAVLESIMSSDFEGSICGMDFIDYWKKERWEFLQNVVEQPIKLVHLPTDSYTLASFELSFTMHSKNGYSEKAIYIVQLALKGENEVNSYTIMSINEIGPCTVYGNVNWTESTELRQLRFFEDVPEEQKIIQSYVEALFSVNKSIPNIPGSWVDDATSSEPYFVGRTCDNNIMKPHGKMKLEWWWKKFQLMWHPVDGQTNHTLVQLLGGTKGRYVFRVTMRVQIGTKFDRKPQEWNFRLQMQYNVHGDGKWYINMFEVLCPVVSEFHLMEVHAMAIKEVIGMRMFQMVVNPDMWYSVTHVFDDLISLDQVEFESCAGLNEEKMEKVEKLSDLEQKFWKLNKATNGRMQGYDLGESKGDILRVGERMIVHLYAIWSPLAPAMVHESKWTFFLQWHEHLQVYEIVKISFGCPYSWKGKKWYTTMFFARVG